MFSRRQSGREAYYLLYLDILIGVRTPFHKCRSPELAKQWHRFILEGVVTREYSCLSERLHWNLATD